MKIKLLSGRSYFGMQDVNYPVIVDAEKEGDAYLVHQNELERIGCDMQYLDDPEDPFWPFELNEVEVIL